MYSSKINFKLPTAGNIETAHQLIEDKIHRTPVLESLGINEILSSKLFFKPENLQKVGAFKSRGAVNAVFSLNEQQASKGVCTHSSGNHAQALARAAALRGIKSFIVMPETAPKVKVEAVKSYGGIIEFCEPNLQARESTLKKVQQKTAAIEIHPYDNLKVIEGQATVAKEVFEDINDLDYLICPVGGGGLLSGTLLSREYYSSKTKIIAAEPLGADDAYKSFKSGKFVPSEKPETLADGLLTSLGKYSFPIILNKVDDIIRVKEESIIKAMKLIYQRLKIVIEPSAAVSLAVIIENQKIFENQKIALVLSGGNIDLDFFFKNLQSKIYG